MSKHGTIRRYTLEIEKISQKQFPSFREIKDYLSEHGFDVSERTIQRDIEQIRFEFGIEILYHRVNRGYYIDVENSLNPESFFRFLELVHTAGLLTESLLESKDSLQYFSFDSGGGLTGIENLKPLLKAIKEHRKVSFDHFNFHSGTSRNYTIKPYLLKEYQNRWYVIGIIGGMQDFRTFGLDRIENLKIQTETFTPDTTLNPHDNFKQTIGLVYSDNDVQTVILSFSPIQGKYIKTLPMHSSQTVIIDDAHEYRISLEVVPNYELTQQILKYGEAVKVIEPQWLADEVKGILKRTLEKYT